MDEGRPRGSPATPALSVRDLSVPFGRGPGLSGLSIELGPAERLALVGPSGAGKTSLLRAIADPDRATRGSVWVGGTDVTRLPAERRRMVLLSQRPLLFPHLSVFENVAFPLRVRGAKGRELESRVMAALESVQLASLAPRAPGSLSGGQAHRVALARAVVARPEVLLLDEPLSSLDPALREDVARAVTKVHADYQPAMITVTHDLSAAGRFADRVAVLLDGALAQVGSPAEVFRRPRTAAVARFFGLANELPGYVDASGALSVAGWSIACHQTWRPQESARPEGHVTVLFDASDAQAVPAAAGLLPARILEVVHTPRGATLRVSVPGRGGEGGAGAEHLCEVGLCPGTLLVSGKEVSILMDPQRLHVFPAEPAR